MISEKLKELRCEKNLLQKDIAKYLNISTSAYGYYEQGKRNPDIETVKKLAEFFNVSIDYLLEITDNKKSCTSLQHDFDINKNNCKSFYCSEIEKKISKRLINENIIKEGEVIPKDVFDKVFKYGIEPVVEILELKKKLDKSTTL